MYTPFEISPELVNVIKEVCQEWVEQHTHKDFMPQEKLIEALHELNQKTFNLEIPE